jgi:DNA (cytosine-5)-methyltransferase 1
MPYRVIDLFSGAGGLTHGFVHGLGKGKFTNVLAMDNDRPSCETYSLNFGHKCEHANIEEWLENNTPPTADVVIGGPPCQGFSLLNKKRQGDARRALWEPYMDIVDASGAKMFVMENVQGLLKSEEFEDIKARANELGFELKYQLLNMADYGVPQTRKRAFVIGYKVEHINFKNVEPFPPSPTHIHPDKGFLLPAWNNVEGAIGDLPNPIGTEIRDEDAPLDLHFGRSPTEVSKKRYRAVPPGGNRFDLQKNAPEITPNCWLNKKSGGTDLFGRLWWDRPSVTIRTEFFKPEKGRYLHPVEHRPITHREAARIMTFPDDFKFVGKKTDIARQIGNAVPPAFAAHIAKYVLTVLDQNK